MKETFKIKPPKRIAIGDPWYYEMYMFKQSGIEICPSKQKIRAELEQLAPIIEGTEFAIDYGEQPTKEEYERYEVAIDCRAKLTTMLCDDTPFLRNDNAIKKEMMINMALLFSSVTATVSDQEVELLVGGIPREIDDLEGWTAFDRFMGAIDEKTEVYVHAEAYLCGEGESVRATPEEVAYIMKRMDMKADFLSSRCDNIESVDFTIKWSPEELFNMEVNQNERLGKTASTSPTV